MTISVHHFKINEWAFSLRARELIKVLKCWRPWNTVLISLCWVISDYLGRERPTNYFDWLINWLLRTTFSSEHHFETISLWWRNHVILIDLNISAWVSCTVGFNHFKIIAQRLNLVWDDRAANKAGPYLIKIVKYEIAILRIGTGFNSPLSLKTWIDHYLIWWIAKYFILKLKSLLRIIVFSADYHAKIVSLKVDIILDKSLHFTVV